MSTNTILASAPLTSTGYHLKANGTTLGNSLIWDNGTNVGIGNTNTSYTLDVSGTGRFTSTLLAGGDVTISKSGDAGLNLNTSTTNGVAVTRYQTTAAGSLWGTGINITGADSRWEIYNFTLGNSPLILSNAGVIDIPYGQIKFPATQNASANANTLDDYEEGTFTPTVSFSGGGSVIYVLRLGTYTKIGRQVTVNLMVNFNDNTGTGNVSIGNLPFTSNSTTNYRLAGSILGAGMTGLVGGLTVYMGAASTTLDILQTNGGVYSGTFVTNANTTTDTDFSIGITYFI